MGVAARMARGVWVALAIAVSPAAPIAAAETGMGPPVPGSPEPESLEYGIEFLFFDPAAIGRISARPMSGSLWEFRIEGETAGAVRGMGYRRRDGYTTIARLTARGFLPVLYTEQSRTPFRDKERRYHFDYAAGKVRTEVRRENGGPLLPEWEHPLSEAQPMYDALTAFFNFRLGWYGAWEDGKVIEVPSIPFKQHEPIRIQPTRLDDAERPGQWMVNVYIENQTIERTSDAIRIRFDRDRVPVETRVRAVLIAGDVVAALKNRNGRKIGP